MILDCQKPVADAKPKAPVYLPSRLRRRGSFRCDASAQSVTVLKASWLNLRGQHFLPSKWTGREPRPVQPLQNTWCLGPPSGTPYTAMAKRAADGVPKKFSSKLLQMKFMQRAVAREAEAAPPDKVQWAFSCLNST